MPLATPKPTKGRAAGDDPFYTFESPGHPDIHLPSVTSIIKDVFSPVFQPAAYWGGHQALRWANDLQTQYSDADALYEAWKQTEYAPNAARDKGAKRGTRAHEILEFLCNSDPKRVDEYLAAGKVTNGYDDATIAWFRQQRADWEPVLVEQVVFWIPDEWRDFNHDVTYRLRSRPEVSFEWNPKYAAHLEKVGYAGTTDLFRRATGAYAMIDGDDLKTHKPPVRFEDHLQVAAYGKAAIRMGLIPAGKWQSNTIILAKENGTYIEEERWVDPEVFSQVRSVYQAMQEGGK